MNLKFLAGLLALLIVFGTGVHLLHGSQVKRNAGSLLEEAHRASAEGRDVPTDNDALAAYALMLDKLAQSPKAQLRAYLVLGQVLCRQPDRQDICRRLAELAMKFGRFHDAEEYLSRLRAEPPKDAEIEELLGRCRLARGSYREALDSFQNAIQLSADCVDSYLALVLLFHDHAVDIKRKGEKFDGDKRAEEILAAMIAANKQSYKTYLGRAQYLRRTARSEACLEVLAEAEKDLIEARRLAPNEADLFLASAEFAQARQDFAKVREYLISGCAKHPKDARLYRFLATLEQEDGNTDEAVSCLRGGLENIPKDRELQWELANAFVQQDQTEEVSELVEQLRRERFSPVLLDYLQAQLLLNKKEWQGAADFCLRTNKLPGAVVHLEKIVQLKFKDREAGGAARRVLALVQTRRGDYRESRKVLALVGLLEDGRLADPENETAQERRTQAQPSRPLCGIAP